MKKIIIILLLIEILFLFGCGKETNSKMIRSSLTLSAQSEVTLAIKDISSSSAVVTIYNGSTNKISYGAVYKFVLEKEIDGIWYVCERAEKTEEGHNIAATDEEHFLESGMADESEIFWDFLYGDLPTGKYRFIKEIWISPNHPSFTGDYIAAEFEIGAK